jgi:uncharacterized protein
MSDTVVTALVAAVMVVGVAGTVLPVLPGLWLILAAGVAYGAATGFGAVGWVALGIMSVLAIGGTLVTVVLPQRRATRVGVPIWGQALAATLAVVGLFVIPLVGAMVGFVLGILIASLRETGEVRAAIPVAFATLVTMLVASAIQFTSGVAMFVTWIVWAFVG